MGCAPYRAGESSLEVSHKLKANTGCLRPHKKIKQEIDERKLAGEEFLVILLLPISWQISMMRFAEIMGSPQKFAALKKGEQMEDFVGAPHARHHGKIEKFFHHFFRGDGWLLGWVVIVILAKIICEIAGIEGPH